MLWKTDTNKSNAWTGALRGGSAAAILTLILMMATEPLLPIVWDEGCAGSA
jgi:hypothetical protein